MSTLIKHGHHYSDIWDFYNLDEVHFYYAECRIQEIIDFKNQCIAARTAQAGKKDWTKFTKSLDKDLAMLRLEVEDEVIEGSTSVAVVRGDKGIDAFFKSIMSVPKLSSVKKTKEG